MSANTISSRDITGSATLQVVSTARAFNDWMFGTIAQDIRQPVLEIGSGIGNISERMVDRFSEVYLSDIEKEYCAHLSKRFNDNPAVREILMIDLVAPDFRERYRTYEGLFASVVLLNVIEHIEDHELAVRNAAYLLQQGGSLVMLAPAFRFLYCRYDRELGHFRRYTRNSMKNLLEQNGFTVRRSQYFNFTGIAGWFLLGKIMGRRQLDKTSMALYDKLVPLNRLIDRITYRFAGLSILQTGIKK